QDCAVRRAVSPELADLLAAVGDLEPLSPTLVRDPRLRAEHERALLDEYDPRPRAAAARDQNGHDLAQDVVGVTAPVQDPVDRLERVRGRRGHEPASNSSTGRRHSSGLSRARRWVRSTSTSVWLAVTIRTSSGSR